MINICESCGKERVLVEVEVERVLFDGVDAAGTFFVCGACLPVAA